MFTFITQHPNEILNIRRENILKRLYEQIFKYFLLYKHKDFLFKFF